jgi:signal transduction histidine kinase
MAFAGIDGIRTLLQIEASNDEIREQFLLRTRVLERIRDDLYVSGTFVRDYLLEPEPGKAEGHRYSMLETRADMDDALNRYRTLLNAQEAGPFGVLTRELAEYWKVLEPVLQWNAEQRRTKGYIFLRDEVFPRRQAMLGISDQIRMINEGQLNEGKLEVARTFDRIRQRLVITIGLTIGLGLLLAVFTVGRLERHYREIAQARSELQQLSARLVEAQENERISISRELHDEVGQSLTGVLLEMAHLSSLIRGGEVEAAATKTGEIKKLLENSISVVRNLALLLRPSMLDDLGLVPALQWQARETSKRSGLWVNVKAEGVSEDLPDDYKTCVYRIVQEALHNCVQHAGAHNANVTVAQEPNRLLLSIRDDGHGFNVPAVRGMGLLGIQERVSHLAGQFSVESGPGQGTLLRVTLPLGPKPA